MADNKENNHELFAAWLAQNAPAVQLSDLYLSYDRIEAYCLKTKVLSKPLFETTDLDTVKKVQKAVDEWGMLRYSYIQRKICTAAVKYYADFVKSLPENILPKTDVRIGRSIAYTKPAPIPEPPAPAASERPSGAGKDRALFREWLMQNQNLTEEDAENCSSAIAICEDLAARLGILENRLYGVDYAKAHDITSQLMKTAGYSKTNTIQHNRFDRAIMYYLLYLRAAGLQKAAAPTAPVDNDKTDFDRFFDDPKYKLLYEKLKEKNITTIEDLKKVNLWVIMNYYQLYTVNQRHEIANELNAKLRDFGKKPEESGYIIHYNGSEYKGASPSEAFVAFLDAAASKYPLRVRNLLGEFHPSTRKVVLSRCEDASKLRLTNPTAYVDAGLSSEQVEQYTAWVLERCYIPQKEFTVEDNRKPIAPPVSVPMKIEEEPPETPASETPKPAETYTTAPSLFDKQEMEETEEFLKLRDMKGATYGELQNRLSETMTATRNIVNRCPRVIELNGRLYHADALVDFEEGADALERILEKLVKKGSGTATSNSLYEYTRGEMSMFLNDNGLTDQQSVYDFARYLFEKIGYHGKRYAFRQNKYISLPEVAIDSREDIVIKYARENGPVVTFKELETHLNELGVRVGNINHPMKIEWKPEKSRKDKQPLFLIYDEDKAILAELMNIDEAFLETVHTALRKLFADSGGTSFPAVSGTAGSTCCPIFRNPSRGRRCFCSS